MVPYSVRERSERGGGPDQGRGDDGDDGPQRTGAGESPLVDHTSRGHREPAVGSRPPGSSQPATLPPADDVTAWYRDNARDLPWRRPGTTAWAILLSEVMSQQTPVARVVPAWREWLRRWPGPGELAEAPTSEVLRVWGRLGYPRRALRLKECAHVVVERHGGSVPQDEESLLALPGVGAYTAAAVLAFAYGRRALVLDTNVRRVLARAVSGQALPPPGLTRAERERARSLLPAQDAQAAAWSVAVMELGALVCTARRPRCEDCPWAGACAWVAAGRPEDTHVGRRRPQAWRGTDRQARGMVMAVLRDAAGGRPVTASALREVAAQAWLGCHHGAEPVAGASPPPQRLSSRAVSPSRAAQVLSGLAADGLIMTDDNGATFRLP